MTSGSKLEVVGSLRSAGGFHGVRANFGVAALWDRLCFAAKFLWWPIWTSCLVPYSNLGPTAIQIRGQGTLPGSILSRHMRMVGDALLGHTQPPTLDACESIDCLSTCITDIYVEYVAFHHVMCTICGWCYGTYMSIPNRVTIRDSDGMGPCTRLYGVGCAWASIVVPHHR
jgi:hypothetical protein